MGKIYETMRRCIDECGASDTPFLSIAEFCDRLRESDGWTSDQIDRVQYGAWQTMVVVNA